MKQLLYFICILLLSVVGCKKDDTHQPSQPAPGTWLLSKIYTTNLSNSFDTITRLTEAFIYNGADKMPSLDITFSTYNTDTAHLDSLFYDGQNRLIRMGGVFFSGGHRSGHAVKTIHYGADGKIDSLRIIAGSNTSAAPAALYSFKYTGAIVMQYLLEPAPELYVPDSFRYTYNNGNLIEWRSLDDPQYNEPEIYSYSDYDNCNNIFSYLNMNVYLPFGSNFLAGPMNVPILSKNNYQIVTIQSSAESVDAHDLATVTVNEFVKDTTGLIVQKTGTAVAGGKIRYRYEYIPGE